MPDPGRPFLPRVGEVYWVDATILPFDGPERHRAVVVLEAPIATSGTIAVALQHGAGRFPVQGILWTPANVTPVP